VGLAVLLTACGSDDPTGPTKPIAAAVEAATATPIAPAVAAAIETTRTRTCLDRPVGAKEGSTCQDQP
jgi:hypothetical protein